MNEGRGAVWLLACTWLATACVAQRDSEGLGESRDNNRQTPVTLQDGGKESKPAEPNDAVGVDRNADAPNRPRDIAENDGGDDAVEVLGTPAVKIPDESPMSSAGSADAGATIDEETRGNAGTGADCAIVADAGTDGSAEEDRPPPAVHVGSLKFKSVSLGLHHACGMRDDDTIACWGNDQYGQATPPEGAFKAVGAGYYYSCALTLDDEIHCWGSDAYGKTDSPSGTFKALSITTHSACAIRTDDAVVCWGADYITEPPSGTFTSVSAFGNDGCALRLEGTLACWGQGALNTTDAPSGEFAAVGTRGPCAMTPDGTLACWGCFAPRWRTPVPSDRVVAMAGLCAIRADDRTAICWGYGDSDIRTPAAGAFSPGTFDSLAVGHYGVCGVQTDGTVACWGHDQDGETNPP
jgi:hypothetical protein